MNAEPITIWDLLTRVNGSDLAGVIVVAMALAVATIFIIAMTVQQMHKNRLDDELKRDLVERGFAAEEIARIVESSPPQRSLRQLLRGRCTPKEPSHARVD
jgi:hypothetical protein